MCISVGSIQPSMRIMMSSVPFDDVTIIVSHVALGGRNVKSIDKQRQGALGDVGWRCALSKVQGKDIMRMTTVEGKAQSHDMWAKVLWGTREGPVGQKKVPRLGHPNLERFSCSSPNRLWSHKLTKLDGQQNESHPALWRHNIVWHHFGDKQIKGVILSRKVGVTDF